MSEETSVTTVLERHEKEISMLRDKAHKAANDLMTSENNAGEMASHLERDLTELRGELQRLGDRIPTDMATRLVRFELKMDAVATTIAADVVKRTEFEVLKVEHDQMKKLMWGFIVMVLTAVLGGIIALVVRG